MSPPLIAFGFESLPMLGWLAAATAPVLIHLWSRRKYREMSWAAMEYLLAAMKRHARRLQFEQLLLLILRTLLVVLIVLAVAEPFFQRAGGGTSTAGRTHHVLVLDGSYSMGYKPSDQTRFDAAKQLARQIVEQSPEGDAFTLILAAAPPSVVIGTPALAARDVLPEIDALTLRHTSFDLSATIAVAAQVVANAKRELPRIERHEVLFLTDLGRVGWQPDLSSAAAAEFRQRTAGLAEEAALRIIDVGQPAADNLAVARVNISEPVVLAGQPVTVAATLRNFGRQPRSRQNVELLIDGRRVGQQKADVGADGEATLSFPTRFETPGDHAVEVRAVGDALEIDNHRWLSVPVRQALQVLCIDGRPSGDRLGGAAGYLAYALSPQADPASRRVEVDVAPESALSERDLSRYDCVLLAAVAQFTGAEARILETYLRGGGNLVFFLGEGVSAERYNRELGPAGRNLLPATIGAVIDKLEPGLNALDFAHPLVRAFKGRGKASLLTTPVLKHFKLVLPEGSQSRVALALASGDPLVVEAPLHRGRVVLVATSPDAAWTPMPVLPSYVPLVQEIVAFCAAGELQRRNVAVGDSIGAALPPAQADAAPNVVGPDGRPRAVQLSRGPAGAGWTCGDTMLAGIYAARFGETADRGLLFAAQANVAESDLTPMAPDELRREVWPGIAFEVLPTWSGDAHDMAAAVLPRARPFSVGLLYAALALLVAETILAWRFGHHAT